MQLLQLLIIKLLLLTSTQINAAATGNSNDAINSQTKREDLDLKDTRDKRSLGLFLFSSLLQNSAPPQPEPKTTTTTTPPPPPPPQYIYNPSFGYKPQLPYLPDKNGYINFNVPDGYVLVTPPPPTTQAPPAPTLPLKLQKKQSFLNFLATLSAGAQPAPTTTKAPPQGILIPKSLLPTYQQQLQQRAIYKYAQYDDTSSDAVEHAVAPKYTYSATHTDEPASYYEEGPGPVDSSYYKSSHNAYEKSPVYSSDTPERFRITYPDDTEYYQPSSSETSQYQQEDSQQAQRQPSSEQYQSEHGYSQPSSEQYQSEHDYSEVQKQPSQDQYQSEHGYSESYGY